MSKKALVESKKEMYVKCTHCGDEVYWNTRKRLTFCRCEKISVDGCEYYIRINGDPGDYTEVRK